MGSTERREPLSPLAAVVRWTPWYASGGERDGAKVRAQVLAKDGWRCQITGPACSITGQRLTTSSVWPWAEMTGPRTCGLPANRAIVAAPTGAPADRSSGSCKR